MTLQGSKHIMEVMQRVRKKMIDEKIIDPMILEQIQECIGLCLHDIEEKEKGE
mgnify:CR=1 FL=1|tara:strand:- start:6139 stop:6297 length:159 start_codon:yes stop_codon:yes gene_type:complete